MFDFQKLKENKISQFYHIVIYKAHSELGFEKCIYLLIQIQIPLSFTCKHRKKNMYIHIAEYLNETLMIL